MPDSTLPQKQNEALEALENRVDYWAVQQALKTVGKERFEFNSNKLGIIAAQINIALELGNDDKIDEQNILDLIYAGLLSGNEYEQRQAALLAEKINDLNPHDTINGLPEKIKTFNYKNAKEASEKRVPGSYRKDALEWANANGIMAATVTCGIIFGICLFVPPALLASMSVSAIYSSFIGPGILSYTAANIITRKTLITDENIDKAIKNAINAERKEFNEEVQKQELLNGYYREEANDFVTHNISRADNPKRPIAFRPMPKVKPA